MSDQRKRKIEKRIEALRARMTVAQMELDALVDDSLLRKEISRVFPQTQESDWSFVSAATAVYQGIHFTVDEEVYTVSCMGGCGYGDSLQEALRDCQVALEKWNHALREQLEENRQRSVSLAQLSENMISEEE